jgi:hypothetical protein
MFTKILSVYLFCFLNNVFAATIQMDKTAGYKNYKLCKNCKHFLPTMYGDKFDIGKHMGRCSLYGKINLVTGEIEHEYASIVRSMDSMCGINGTYFEDNSFSEVEKNMFPI